LICPWPAKSAINRLQRDERQAIKTDTLLLLMERLGLEIVVAKDGSNDEHRHRPSCCATVAPNPDLVGPAAHISA
jgi:hypothetical protein